MFVRDGQRICFVHLVSVSCHKIILGIKCKKREEPHRSGLPVFLINHNIIKTTYFSLSFCFCIALLKQFLDTLDGNNDTEDQK